MSFYTVLLFSFLLLLVLLIFLIRVVLRCSGVILVHYRLSHVIFVFLLLIFLSYPRAVFVIPVSFTCLSPFSSFSLSRRSPSSFSSLSCRFRHSRFVPVVLVSIFVVFVVFLSVLSFFFYLLRYFRVLSDLFVLLSLLLRLPLNVILLSFSSFLCPPCPVNLLVLPIRSSWLLSFSLFSCRSRLFHSLSP